MDSHIPNPVRPDNITMIGLDFGSTTSSAMVATAGVGLCCITGRMEIGAPRVVYRSDPVFTPFNGERIDPVRLDSYVDRWMTESGVRCEELFAGGVIVTGLAAKQTNAASLARIIGENIGEAVVATADDPCLESWLAFMGSCSVLSRFHSKTPFINIDIGGGTTNPAFGINGNVVSTGCHFVGARHFQFIPGTYRLTGISSYGRALLRELGIEKRIGAELTDMERVAVLDFYIAALEAIAIGNAGFFTSPVARLHLQVPFGYQSAGETPVLVFSGGVGELIYRESKGEELPGTTYYGDFGIDLAQRILESPLLSAHVQTRVPENMGRATVYGLTLHSTEISGSTIFLSSADILPLRDLPIVARLPIDAPAGRIRQALALVETGSNGACIQVVGGKSDAPGGVQDTGIPAGENLETVKTLGRRLNEACNRKKPGQPVVILVPDNYGQALGNYVTNWRQEGFHFCVIDEIPDRHAHFVNIGRMSSNIVPVSFYGIC